MFGSSVASPSATVTSPQASPSRSRHRGLSYLRSYTHNRLSSSHQTTTTNTPTSTAASRPARLSLSRSQSYPQSPLTSPTAPATQEQGQSPTQQDRDGQQPGNNVEATVPIPQTSQPAVASGSQGQAVLDGAAEGTGDMARNRAANTTSASGNQATSGTRATAADRKTEEVDETHPPTIRFYPHQELPNGRPSLHFSPIVRTLPSYSSVIKVGRYSEREGVPIANPTSPSDAPVGFKSKVVSRKHCEFSFVNGSWHIKDAASSSGTFLNHVRLSQPNQVSRLFPVKDGDVVQLGIDFKGGEEMIFRCVKIRIECNRSWQQRPNKYNQERHAQLVRKKPEAAAGGIADNSGECSICLSSVMPCQSLFVAPCAHVWHFKCIYPLLIGKKYPHFSCPNCRAIWNLEADVDAPDSEGDWEEGGQPDEAQNTGNDGESTTAALSAANPIQDTQHIGAGATGTEPDNDTSIITGNLSLDEGSSMDEAAAPPTLTSGSGLLARRHASIGAPAQTGADGVHDIELPDVPVASAVNIPEGQPPRVNTPLSGVDILSGEGPLTPRNNAGPFVFDGSAGRPGSRRGQDPLLSESADP